MPTISVMIAGGGDESSELLEALDASPLVETIFVCGDPARGPSTTHKIIPVEDSAASGPAVNRILESLASDYLLWVRASDRVRPGQRMLERLTAAAEDQDPGLIYSDFREETEAGVSEHGLIDYQLGSSRDTFDFGSLWLFSTRSIKEAISRHGPVSPELRW